MHTFTIAFISTLSLSVYAASIGDPVSQHVTLEQYNRQLHNNPDFASANLPAPESFEPAGKISQRQLSVSLGSSAATVSSLQAALNGLAALNGPAAVVAQNSAIAQNSQNVANTNAQVNGQAAVVAQNSVNTQNSVTTQNVANTNAPVNGQAAVVAQNSAITQNVANTNAQVNGQAAVVAQNSAIAQNSVTTQNAINAQVNGQAAPVFNPLGLPVAQTLNPFLPSGSRLDLQGALKRQLPTTQAAAAPVSGAVAGAMAGLAQGTTRREDMMESDDQIEDALDFSEYEADESEQYEERF